MRTKYIHYTDGSAILFNEASGMEHWMVLNDIYHPAALRDAGFAYHDGQNFKVYGNSISLGVTSNPFAGDDLSKALRDGNLRILSFPHLPEHSYVVIGGDEGEVITSIDEIYAARVLTEDS